MCKKKVISSKLGYKRSRKLKDFLMFPEGIEKQHRAAMG